MVIIITGQQERMATDLDSYHRRFLFIYINEKQLQQRINEIKEKTKPSGDYSIIFGGDVCQLEPSGSSDSSYCFQDNPADYGTPASMLSSS